MTKNLLSKALIAPVLAVLLWSGCKDPEMVGLNTIPNTQGFGVQTTDTFTIEGAHYLVDSLITSNLSTAYLLGGMNDPVFGKVSSTLYTQFHLESSNVNFGTDPTIDSVVVYLNYHGGYGSLDKLKGYQEIEVFELDEILDGSETYYQETSHSATTLRGSVGFSPDLVTGLTVPSPADTLEFGPTLRIPIDPDYGQTILNAGTDALASNDEFVKVIKGLVFKPKVDILLPSEGSILYFDMDDSQTRMRLYYKQSGENKVFDLFVHPTAATYTAFDHEFPQELLDDTGNTVAGEEFLYVQAVGGVRSELRFPTFRNLALDDEGNERSISINKAELVIPIEGENYADFDPPIILDLTFDVFNNDSIHSEVVDDFAEGVEHFGGVIDVEGPEYRFNVSRQMQWFLNNPDNEVAFRLYTLGQAVTGYRGVLNGTKHPVRPIKLEVTFTETE